MKPVRVLQFTIGGTEYTGIASFLYQYYQKIDRNKVHFDFVFGIQNSLKQVSDDPIFADSKFIELNTGSRANEIDYSKLKKGIEQVLSAGKYDVFHINTLRVWVTMACIAAAKKSRVPVIISHSHNARFFIEGKSRRRRLANLAKDACAIYIRKNCQYLFACSENAGKALFGSAGIKEKKFKVIKNAVDVDQFLYKADIRSKLRTEEGLQETTLILGQVGRLSVLKNQVFSIEVLASLLKVYPDTELWLVGSGEDLPVLERRVEELNISENVRFLGQRSDVSQVMQAFDAMLFPSFKEGLGIVAIEAQAAGLPIYASTEIPRETQITDLINYLPLSDGPEKWADYIIGDLPRHQRKDTKADIIQSGYDISTAAKQLEEFYLNCANGLSGKNE